MSVYDTARRNIMGQQYGNYADPTFGQNYSDFGSLGFDPGPTAPYVQMPEAPTNPGPALGGGSNEAVAPDPYDTQIATSRGVLAKQRSYLENAIRAQFETTPPVQAQPNLRRNLIPLAIGLGAAVLGGPKGAELGAGIIGGTLQNENQSVQDENQYNLGIYNNMLRRRGADVQAAEVGVQGAQGELQNLMALKTMGLSYQSQMEKAAISQLNNIRTQLGKTGIGPDARTTLMQQANSIRPGSFTDNQIKSAGEFTPSDLKTIGQADLYGARKTDIENSQAYKIARGQHQQIMNDILSGQSAALKAQPGVKNELMAGQMANLANQITNRDKSVSADVSLKMSRENLNNAMQQVVVPKAQAFIDHMAEMDSSIASKLDQSTKEAISKSYDGMMKVAQTAVTNTNKTIARYREVASVTTDKAEKQKFLDAATSLENNELANAKSMLSEATMGATMGRFKMGLGSDGTPAKGAQIGGGTAAKMPPTEYEQKLGEVQAKLKSGEITAHRANELINYLKAHAGG